MKKRFIPIFLAIAAAIFYSFNAPFSKYLLNYVPTTFMASFLYLGAGIGVGIMYLFSFRKEKKEDKLGKKDLPYTILMVVLDIAAPILLMYGLKNCNSSNASLLNNFEIVATSLVALLIFREKISIKLWIAIIFVTLSCVVLSFGGGESFSFSTGSLFVILATLCWGVENNCTRKISNKSTYQIVIVKGLFSGAASFLIAFILGESLPHIEWILLSMLLGFVAYGLSIFAYVRAQRDLGAAKTSVFYSIAPFIGSMLCFVVNKEPFTYLYFIGLGLMVVGIVLSIIDTLERDRSDNNMHTQDELKNDS